MLFDGKALHLGPKKFSLDPIKMREKLRFPGKVMGATIRRDVNKWFISVQVDVGDHHKDRTADGAVGVGVGITVLATLSTGEKIDGPKPLKKAMKKLRCCSRQHSKKKRDQKTGRSPGDVWPSCTSTSGTSARTPFTG